MAMYFGRNSVRNPLTLTTLITAKNVQFGKCLFDICNHWGQRACPRFYALLGREGASCRLCNLYISNRVFSLPQLPCEADFYVSVAPEGILVQNLCGTQGKDPVVRSGHIVIAMIALQRNRCLSAFSRQRDRKIKRSIMTTR